MSKNDSFSKKLSHHSLAIVSLLVAIIALTYNTWRSDTTEYNRNIRTASFEMIKQLGELQNITHQLHFSQVKKGKSDELLIKGWGHIALIEDLSALLPNSIRAHAIELKISWQGYSESLGLAENAEHQISARISATRTATRQLLISLD